MIKPTVGRVVYFRDRSDKERVLAAIIVDVLSDTEVSLVVFDKVGHSTPFPGVPLVQPDQLEKGDIPNTAYCHWMPFQVGQGPSSQDLLNRIGALEARLSGEVSPLAGSAPTSLSTPALPLKGTK